MLMTKRVLLASGATLALASAVHAQGQPQGSDQMDDVLMEERAFSLSPNGKAAMMRINPTGAEMIKKYGTELNARAMFYRSGGKNYLLQDRKMADGTMLFDKMGDWRAK